MSRQRAKRMPYNGRSKHPLYGRWSGMMGRCRNPQHENFIDYGARGISVCARWHEFDHFVADMGNPPVIGMTIERRNNSGNYEPNNCFWATRRAQSLNRRSNHMITFMGETMPMALWADRAGISFCAFKMRLKRGWSFQRAISEQPKRGLNR